MTIYCRNCEDTFHVEDFTKEYWKDGDGSVHIKVDCDVIGEAKK